MGLELSFRNQLISFGSIGHSGNDEGDRLIGQGIKANGWQWFIDTKIQPHIDMGCKRFELHNPGGVERGEVMDFDQFQEAREAPGQQWIYEKFAEAWAPILAQDIEVIAYLGSLKADSDFTQSMPPHKYIERVAQSIQDVEGMTIAFDHLGGKKGVGPTHPGIAVMDLVEALGHKVYYEPWPHRLAKHLHCRNCWTNDTFYRSNSARWGSPAHWGATRWDLKGKIIRYVRSAAGDRTYTQTVEEVLKDGDSCSCKFHLIDNKLPGWLS